MSTFGYSAPGTRAALFLVLAFIGSAAGGRRAIAGNRAPANSFLIVIHRHPILGVCGLVLPFQAQYPACTVKTLPPVSQIHVLYAHPASCFGGMDELVVA
jgi:hypothetical protein